MAVIAPASDVAILCPFELTGTLSGRLQVVIPYAAVEPAKKLLASPPRLGGGSSDGDARFSAALARELAEVEVEVRVEIGRRTLNLSELLGAGGRPGPDPERERERAAARVRGRPPEGDRLPARGERRHGRRPRPRHRRG